MFNDVIFCEFIEYLIIIEGNSSSLVMDWYWENYVNVCGMCVINYDIFG